MIGRAINYPNAEDRRGWILLLMLAALCTVVLLLAPAASAHAVSAGDKGFIQETSGVLFLPFVTSAQSTWSPDTTICCSSSA